MEYRVLLVWNIIVFSIYGLDKFNAMNRRWRVSEKNLLSMAFFLGGIGALLGMLVFRHKRKRKKFRIWIPVAIIVNSVTIYLLMNIQTIPFVERLVKWKTE